MHLGWCFVECCRFILWFCFEVAVGAGVVGVVGGGSMVEEEKPAMAFFMF